MIKILLLFLLSKVSYSMHIADGYLSTTGNIFWWGVFLIFLGIGLGKIKKSTFTLEDKLITALLGAFVFFLSALKLPSITGSSSHATGIALGAILLGSSKMYLISLLVLLFQALFLAHGGLLTLGANGFSMGVVGSLAAIGVYNLVVKKLKGNERVGIFLAALLGNLATYSVTAMQLAFSHSVGGILHNFLKFMSLFFLTQIPIGIVEGILSIVVIETLRREKVKI